MSVAEVSYRRAVQDWREEPSLQEMLGDPIVRLMMQRDSVEPQTLIDLLARARHFTTRDILQVGQ